MTRPARLTPAVLMLSTALLLTSCGSGGGDESSSDKIKGADGGQAEASARPSSSASSERAGQPKIPLPASLTMNFEGWSNSDPKLQAVLDDGKEALRANHAAVIEADPDAAYVAFYNEGAALESARTWIKGFVKTDDSLIGKVRVFEPQVRLNSQGLGVLFYCADESKASTKNRKTNKVVGTPDNVSPYLQYRTTLEKTSKGVWKTRSVETERGACGQ
ncbi:hypothetical protein [Streptomyces violaceus]|uniref:Lipoprotein n=1 Tax=Streptomyces violaceus TaxID=1936 RepID=A0ABY9UBN3_STRVL|nr:hypothetical protein [Streptomyces janthinus]WND19973.1 hypothetical protein RI060_22690 [Streptomyces janthinus]GGS62642.1 lipoprotein [Streptomyces janthinus]